MFGELGTERRGATLLAATLAVLRRPMAPYALITAYFGLLFAAFGVRGGDLESCGGPDGYGDRGPYGCPWFSGPLHANPLHAAQLRYQTWSSRFTVELVEYGLSHTLWLFALVTIALSWLFLWSVQELLDIRSPAGLSAFAALYWLTIPLSLHTSAGTYSTVIFYSWTLFLGTFSLAVLIRAHRGAGVQRAQWAGAVTALAFALCSEQFLVLFLAVVSSVALSEIGRRRRLSLATAGYILAALGAIVNVLVCPGNAARTRIEVDYWMPSFAQMSLAEKFGEGLKHTLYPIAGAEQCAAAVIAVAVGVAITCRIGTGVRWPLVWTLGAGVVFLLLTVNRAIGLVSVTDHVLVTAVAALALLGPVAVVGVHALKEDHRGRQTALIALVGGVGSAMLMSLSPTIWASADRTLYLLFVCMVAVLFVVVRSARAQLLAGSGVSQVRGPDESARMAL